MRPPASSSRLTPAPAVVRSPSAIRRYLVTRRRVREGAGTRTATSSSSSASTVEKAWTKNRPISTRRVPLRERSSTSASSRSRTQPTSELGSAKQRLPPMVPVARTRTFPSSPAAAASTGTNGRTGCDLAIAAWVAQAPTTTAGPSRTIPSSPSRLRSSGAAGRLRRPQQLGGPLPCPLRQAEVVGHLVAVAQEFGGQEAGLVRGRVEAGQ